MYYMNNIDLTLSIRGIYTYNADFACNSRDLCNIVLICGSNCLRAMRIYSRLSGAFFPTFLNNLHLSTRIEKIDLERALTTDNILFTSHNPPNTSLHKFGVKDFRRTEEARNQLHQYIANNFTSVLW
ncbi:hypothetical protein BDC45DRAFT_535172 [Circinella umbellata]|nr:hypothetical protein BDC45DRAFT_535172 [Circinella umbellata]